MNKAQINIFFRSGQTGLDSVKHIIKYIGELIISRNMVRIRCVLNALVRSKGI